MRHWELARYAIENCLRSPLRTLLTIVGIAIASGALVSMVAFVIGLRRQVEAPIKKLGLLNNIEVTPLSVDGQQRPILDDAALQAIEHLDGVEFAYPDFRLSQVALTRGSETAKTFAVGIPREASLVGFTRELLVAGTLFTLGGGKEIVLSEGMVQQLGLPSAEAAIGESVTLEAGGLVPTDEQQFEFDNTQISLHVTGVFRSPGFTSEFGRGTVLLPVELMRQIPASWMEGGVRRLRANNGRTTEGFPRVIVRSKTPGDVIRVGNTLREMGYETDSVMDQVKEMRQFFVFMEVLLTSVGTVALVVAGLGILNTMLMTVMERVQEIGIYKSIGASDGDIRWLFLVEAALAGLGGGVAGLALARAVSWILGWAFNTYAASQGVEGPLAVFEFPWWLLGGAVVYSIAISILSGLYPAARAARIDPIQALRRD